MENLRSRIVVIKGYEQPEQFLAATQRQLEQLGIQESVCIPTNHRITLPGGRSPF